MATTTEKHIAVWLDKTSDPDDPRWIVSREDDKGSATLRVFDPRDRRDAKAYAEQVAGKEGLEVRAE